VRYIVPKEEERAFLARWPRSDIISVPNKWRISEIREHLIREYKFFGTFQALLDDDLVFLRRKAPLDIHQRKGNADDAAEAFARVENWLHHGFVHGSLSQRGGNNHVPGPYKLVGRSTDFHFYNAEVLAACKIKPTRVILRQDFFITLSLLRLGYPNVIDYEFMSGQKDGAPGGCSLYRDHALLEAEAHKLARLFPEFVKVVTKERKGGFGVSTDVRVAWKKAFESSAQDYTPKGYK
jgi:hypothetical protein